MHKCPEFLNSSLNRILPRSNPSYSDISLKSQQVTFQGNLWSHRVWVAIRRPEWLSKLPGLRAIPPQWVQGKQCSCVPAAQPLYPRQQSPPQVPHTAFTSWQIQNLCYITMNFLEKQFWYFPLLCPDHHSQPDCISQWCKNEIEHASVKCFIKQQQKINRCHKVIRSDSLSPLG